MQIGRKKKPNNDHRKKTDPFYLSTFWKRLVSFIWLRDQGLCQECLRKGIYTQLRKPASNPEERGFVDHIKPRKAGGQDHEDNLQLLCKRCHDIKSNDEKKYYV